MGLVQSSQNVLAPPAAVHRYEPAEATTTARVHSRIAMRVIGMRLHAKPEHRRGLPNMNSDMLRRLRHIQAHYRADIPLQYSPIAAVAKKDTMPPTKRVAKHKVCRYV